MARKQTTRDSKKLKDKWKAKQWYSIVAPEMFNRAKIGETLADEPEKLLGRTVEVTLQDLTGDFRMMHVKLKFKIIDHSTSEAYTRFLGHDLTSDYIRRQTRRKRTKMEGVFDVTTKDGYTVRLKPMAISDKRIQSSVQYEIRKKMASLITEVGSSKTMAQLTSMVLTSDKDRSLVNLIQKECRGIYPLKRVDMRKMEVLNAPEKDESTENIFASPVPEEEASEAPSPAAEDAKPEEPETPPVGEEPAEEPAPVKE
ncbi:30S ribosomal protein S3ae [Thermoplasmatales archaeon ex4484_6]|nr:MAG: 30S ribosomal protein S3ae [Thermoplasmatales archaeon ex4484_6]RLF65306.1 MAG: 30S ribosomal protein S3ae [Thermoplasmata archaeon]